MIELLPLFKRGSGGQEAELYANAKVPNNAAPLHAPLACCHGDTAAWRFLEYSKDRPMKLLGARGWSQLALLAALAIVCGCNRAPAPQPEPTTAREVLDRMVTAYRQAKTYADSGEARVTFFADGQKIDDTMNFSVSLERPNKVRINLYDCNMVCDGNRLQATVGEIPNQVLSVKAPERLTTNDIYRNSDILVGALARQVAGGPIQLALLLDDEPLVPVLDGAQTPVLLEPKQHPDGPCYRVLIDRDDGKLVFWIERNSFVLRRVELPTDRLYEELSARAKVSDLSVVAELKGARLDDPIDAVAFQFAVPEGAKLVDSFRTIPRPEPLSNLLGKPIPEFTFTGLDGHPVTRDSLAGKVAVLYFWATWCGPCFQTLPELETVFQKYKGRGDVAFVAVSIDRSRPSGGAAPAATQTPDEQPPATDQQLADAFKAAEVHIPIARDLKQFANISFGVQQIPNLFVLGPDGKVQDHEIGYNPQLAKELPGRLEKLLAGQSIFDDARRRYDVRLREYEAQFQAPAGQQASGGDLPRANIAPQGPPTHLKLTKLWRYDALKQPGNILVVPASGGKPKILIVDGWNHAIAELDADGKLVKLHQLDLPKQPEDGIVGYLRTMVDSDGKRYFVGAASGRQQMHLFDEHFARLWSYPDGTSAGGIADVQPGDLDGDGHPELNVSYYDVVGVQNVSLAGKRLWANRSLANVFRLAVTGAGTSGRRQLLCANQRGVVVPIDSQGRDGSPLDVNRRFLRSVYSAQLLGDGRTQYCGIAMVQTNQDLQELVVGFDLSGRELWSFPLPVGLQHDAAVEMVTSGNVLGATSGQWIVAGADGSVNILSAEGVAVDHFKYGQAISGLAAADLGGPALVIATGKGVEAYKVEDGQSGNLSLQSSR
jgi:thiol-disulfide isomerase/thioredoxin